MLTVSCRMAENLIVRRKNKKGGKFFTFSSDKS